ncbi:DUF417 family protein [Rheinheimera faecalis]|uniref:DUF417 family protein n=1 Tax=Rheinheimera faecalis TaxID=2901141 RepID=UPI001E2BFA8A
MKKKVEKPVPLLSIAVIACISLSFALLALSSFAGVDAGLVKILGFYQLTKEADLPLIRQLSSILFSLLALLPWLTLHFVSLKKPLALLLVLCAVPPLVSLTGSIHWIESLGGFPAIGSGQGIIKYATLLALAWHFWLPDNKVQHWVQYAPVALVLVWIGGMKFTQIEAEGIADLVQSSPLMSWLYLWFDQQTTSNLIGIYDLLALLLLGAGLYYRWLFLPGWLMCLAVFLTTQTFLFSFPGAFSAHGLLTASGQFLIKDLWFIASMLLLLQWYLTTKQPQQIKQS